MATSQVDSDATVYHLNADRTAVAEARHLASEVAADRMSPAQRYNLELAVTEVVANAVRHSGSGDHIILVMSPKDGYVCVQVTDGGAGLVPQPGAMRSEEGAGFGLFIVEQLTRRWGVTREDGKTRVWFELGYEASSAKGWPATSEVDAPFKGAV